MKIERTIVTERLDKNETDEISNSSLLFSITYVDEKGCSKICSSFITKLDFDGISQFLVKPKTLKKTFHWRLRVFFRSFFCRIKYNFYKIRKARAEMVSKNFPTISGENITQDIVIWKVKRRDITGSHYCSDIIKVLKN